MSSSEAPKPCDWCGQDVEVTRAAGYGFTVECVNETCQVGPSLNITRGRENAIRAWNTRANHRHSPAVQDEAENIAADIIFNSADMEHMRGRIVEALRRAAGGPEEKSEGKEKSHAE